MAKNFYVLEYAAGESGCPHHLSGELNHESWEWSLFEPQPDAVEVNKEYVFTISDEGLKKITFDLYGGDTYFVSGAFLDLCRHMKVAFRAIQIDIIMADGKKSDNDYWVFLPAQHLQLMDEAKSDFKYEHDLSTGDIVTYKSFPSSPIYSWIRRFTPKVGVDCHLFRCLENMNLVCSEDFRDECISRKLLGLKFTPVDEGYTYDPWGEIEQ